MNGQPRVIQVGQRFRRLVVQLGIELKGELK